MKTGPVIFGTDDSVYVRIVRLALEEKRVAYTLEPVDVFAAGGPPADYLDRHPFGRMPAFEFSGFRLYETGAITRYIDEVFEGAPLQPDNIEGRARMNQIIGIADSYVYRPLVWDIFVERVNKPLRGESSDEGRIAAGLERAHIALRAITRLMGSAPWLAGGRLSLADLYLAPMLAYFFMTPEGRMAMPAYPELLSWWSRMIERPSMAATRFSL